jgi:hypothetical protein
MPDYEDIKGCLNLNIIFYRVLISNIAPALKGVLKINLLPPAGGFGVNKLIFLRIIVP